MRDWFQAAREHESMFMKPSPSLPPPVPSLSSPDETQTVAPQGNRITLERGEGITAIQAEAILDSICARAKAENSHEVYYPALTGLLKFHFTEMLQHPGYHLERLLRDHGYSIPPAPTTESSPVSSSLAFRPAPQDTEESRAKAALEPVKVQRWDNWGPDNTMATKFNGEWVRYADIAHLLQGKGQEDTKPVAATYHTPEWRELVPLEIIDSETEYRFSDIHVWIKGGSLVGTTVQKCAFEYGQQFRARRRVGTERGNPIKSEWNRVRFQGGDYTHGYRDGLKFALQHQDGEERE